MDLANPGIELGSPALQAVSLPAELPGKPTDSVIYVLIPHLEGETYLDKIRQLPIRLKTSLPRSAQASLFFRILLLLSSGNEICFPKLIKFPVIPLPLSHNWVCGPRD